MEVCGCNTGCLLKTGNLDLKRNYCVSSETMMDNIHGFEEAVHQRKKKTIIEIIRDFFRR
jgi:hypothetical protein